MTNHFSDDALAGDIGAEKQDPIKPLFTVSKGEESSKWIKNTFRVLMKRNESFFAEVKENLKLYKGQVFDSPKSSSGARTTNEAVDPAVEKARNAKLYDNKIYDLLEWRVTTHNADKPGVDIGPANVEYEDRIGATMAKSVYDHVNYQNDGDAIERTALRNTFLSGEHYVATLWDPNKGDVNPQFQKLSDETEGDEVYIDGGENEKQIKWPKNKPIRNGDVVLKHLPSWKVLPEPVECWEDVNWIMTWDTEYMEVLKKKYPKAKEAMKEFGLSERVEGFDNDFINRLREEGKMIVVTVYERKHEYNPEGRLMVYTINGGKLADSDLPYDLDGQLPVERLTDMDLPGELRGRSYIRNLKGLQYQQFFLTSMAAANLRLMGYPKWVVDQGSVNVKDLVNARTVIQKRVGSAAPMILQPNPTSPEVYKQISDLGTSLDAKVKGNFANPESLPARIDSAVALQYLDEKDLKRTHTMVSKVNAFRVALAKKIIMIAAQYYRVDDDRVLNIVGKNHEHDIKFFNFQNFKRPYVIRVKSGNALPDSKAAKMDYIMTLTKERPDMLSNQQVMDLLDLGSVEKLVDITTKSLRAAESIIQDLLTGNPVPPPEGYEDLITYWNTFATYIQDRQFKESVPAENKAKVLEYLNGIEMLMVDKGMKNPMFAQKMSALDLFPLVFVLPPSPAEVEAAAGQPSIMDQQEQPEEEMGEAQPPQDDHALHGDEMDAAQQMMQGMVTEEDVQD